MLVHRTHVVFWTVVYIHFGVQGTLELSFSPIFKNKYERKFLRKESLDFLSFFLGLEEFDLRIEKEIILK